MANEKLRELSEKATPGEWTLEYLDGYITGHIISPLHTYCGNRAARKDSITGPDSMTHADGEFIVACVNHVRALLAVPAAGEPPPFVGGKFKKAEDVLNCLCIGTEVDAYCPVHGAHLQTPPVEGKQLQDSSGRCVNTEAYAKGETAKVSADSQALPLERVEGKQGEARKRDVAGWALGRKGICDYCKKPVEVRVNEAWHTKGDKVWHEICSYQQQIELLTAAQAQKEKEHGS